MKRQRKRPPGTLQKCETFRAFFNRRVREMKQSGEWEALGEMAPADFAKLILCEWYDAAGEPVPDPPATRH
jgi:hypothetical protein